MDERRPPPARHRSPAAPARHRSPAEPKVEILPSKKNVEVVGLDDNLCENFFPVVLWGTTAFGEPARDT